MAEPEQAAVDPVELGRAREAQAELGAVGGVVAPRMRRKQVLALAMGAGKPHALLGPLEARARVLDEREEVREVLAPRDIRLDRGDEALVGVLAHGFQQTIARAACALGRHQRLVHEVREEIHDVVAADFPARAARLDDCFRLLTGGDKSALPRQQTLRASLDWSHDLLSPAERVLLRRLAVFTGESRS